MLINREKKNNAKTQVINAFSAHFLAFNRKLAPILPTNCSVDFTKKEVILQDHMHFSFDVHIVNSKQK